MSRGNWNCLNLRIIGIRQGWLSGVIGNSWTKLVFVREGIFKGSVFGWFNETARQRNPRFGWFRSSSESNWFGNVLCHCLRFSVTFGDLKALFLWNFVFGFYAWSLIHEWVTVKLFFFCFIINTLAMLYFAVLHFQNISWFWSSVFSQFLVTLKFFKPLELFNKQSL